jgi:hypothetical protein
MRSTLVDSSKKETPKESNPSQHFSRRKSEVHKNFNYLRFCQAVLDQINYVRVCPNLYIKDLEKYRDSLQDNILRIKKPSEGKENYGQLNEEIYVSEGRKLFDELIQVLKTIYKREPFQLNKSLGNAAEDFLMILQMHDGSDDKALVKSVEDFMKRIRKYGVPHGLLGECIDYGSTSAESLVLKLLLDDGDPTRTDRNIILNANLNSIGIACGMLPSSQTFLTVLDFCEHFFNFNDRIPQQLLKNPLKLTIQSKKRNSVLDYLHKEKNFEDNRNLLSRRKMGNHINQVQHGNLDRKKQDHNSSLYLNNMNQTIGPNDFNRSIKSPLAEASATHLPLNSTNKQFNTTGSFKPNATININIHTENNNLNTSVENGNNALEKFKNSNFQDLLSKVNPDKLLFQGKFMNRVQSQSRLRSSDNGVRNRSRSKDYGYEEEVERPIYSNKDKKNAQKALSRSMINMGTVDTDDYRKREVNLNISQQVNMKSHHDRQRFQEVDLDNKIEFNFDKIIRNIEIENNEHINCINTNKKIIVENGVEKYLVKRKIYFKDGSIDEWCYKEEINS